MNFELQFGEKLFSVSYPPKSWELHDDHGRCGKCRKDLTFVFERWLRHPEAMQCDCSGSFRLLHFVRRLKNPHRKKHLHETNSPPISVSDS